jgi:hypothetical protein
LGFASSAQFRRLPIRSGKTRILAPLPYLRALSPAYLQTKLTRSVPTKDGGALHTVRDAREYMLALSKDHELRAQWQHAVALLLAQADVAVL